MSILGELDWRGLVADCTDRLALAERIKSPITLYCGFDPTADSLHVGNLVPLLGLRRFQLLGHFPIAVAGGATGSIGDPSGKTAERQLLTKEVLEHNISSVKVQLAKLLDFETKQNPARLVDNASWTADVSFLDFLREIGKHFSVNQMVAKESVRARMEDREVGISYTEFSYMLLQAFDFMVLCRDHHCELQIGGSDQWGNITAGIDLCRKKLSKTVYGLTLPLITNADGSKFGKTEAGAVWLDLNKTKKHDFYHFWINTDDRDVIRYLKFFTFLSKEEIEKLERKHTANPAAREAHKVLAEAVTDLVHGKGTTEQIITASKGIFAGEVSELTTQELEKARKELPGPALDPIPVNKPLQEIVYISGLASSKSEARRLIEQNAISINFTKKTDPYLMITANDYLLGNYLIVQKGKNKQNTAMISGSAPIPGNPTQSPPPAVE